MKRSAVRQCLAITELFLARQLRALPWLLGLTALLMSCASGPPVAPAPPISAAEARASIDKAIPHAVADRAGWVADIYAGFTTQSIPPTRQNVCAVVAVIEQESNFRVNPVVPGMGAIARREIDTRAEHAGVPLLLVHGALQLKSATGRSYGERIDAARTEKDLSDIFEDFIGSVPLGAAVVLGLESRTHAGVPCKSTSRLRQRHPPRALIRIP